MGAVSTAPTNPGADHVSGGSGLHAPLRIVVLVQRDLIYDLGAHNGDDTAYYVAEGFRVVSVEANPVLAGRLRQQFAGAPVTVVEGALGESSGITTFWVNEDYDEFSSIDEAVGGRTPNHHSIQVAGITMTDLQREYGVPYYLKSDIELADIHCLRQLTPDDLPQYISVEAHRLEYLTILYALGYREFKCVDQSHHNNPRSYSNERLLDRIGRRGEHEASRLRRRLGRERGFPMGSSGPFGEATPGSWQALDEVAYDWLHYDRGHVRRGTLNPRGWFDFHARLPR